MTALLALLLLAASPLSAGSNAGRSSDPGATGRPAHRDNPVLSALSTRLFLHGYCRVRGSLLDNLDLGRGPTPTSGRHIFPTTPGGDSPITTADLRLRLDLTLQVGRSVKVFTRIDALDNLVLGSTPDGLPRNARVPMIAATGGQSSPTGGWNALTDAIRVKRAYGQVLLPFGYLAAGRMGALTPWGLGVVVHPGDGLDSDGGDTADRVVLALALFGHLVMIAYEVSASGPVLAAQANAPVDPDPRDDVRSFGFAVANWDPPASLSRKLRAYGMVINYGLLISGRFQELDVPGYYGSSPTGAEVKPKDQVLRNAWSVLADVWFRLRTRSLRIELEAVYSQGGIENSSLVPGVTLTRPLTASQFGGVLQVAWAPLEGRWGAGLEVGLASGDSAPGFGAYAPTDQARTVPGDLDGPQIDYPRDTTTDNFRFNSEYRVDLIFWRRIVGRITDALYLKASGHFDLTGRLRLWASAIYSRALSASTPPGGVADLGIEVDAGLRYDYDPGFDIRLTFGVFLPFAGLKNTVLGIDPSPATALHLVMGFVF